MSQGHVIRGRGRCGRQRWGCQVQCDREGFEYVTAMYTFIIEVTLIVSNVIVGGGVDVGHDIHHVHEHSQSGH